MRITILRHGKPNFKWKRLVSGSEIGALAKEYDATGIIGCPPEKLQNIGEQYNFVVCSNLLRSLESANAVGVKEIHLSSPTFREMSIPYFNSFPLILPAELWVLILRGLWFLGFSQNTESITIAKTRAKRAAKKLIELAIKHDDILFIGHGFFNYYLDKELKANHWQSASNSGKKYWSFATYEYKKTN